MFDTVKMVMEVTPERVEDALEEVARWVTKENTSQKELQVLLGKLHFVCKCVRQVRVFVSRLLNLLRETSGHQAVLPVRVPGKNRSGHPPHFGIGDVGSGLGGEGLGTSHGEGKNQSVLRQWCNRAGYQQWQDEGRLYATLPKGDMLPDCQSAMHRSCSAPPRGPEQITRPAVQVVP